MPSCQERIGHHGAAQNRKSILPRKSQTPLSAQQQSSDHGSALDNGAAVARRALRPLLLEMPVAEAFVAARPPEVAQTSVSRLADGQGGFVVHIAGIHYPVPPDEHPPPQVRARRRNLVDRLLVRVLPWVIFHKRDLIHQIA